MLVEIELSTGWELTLEAYDLSRTLIKLHNVKLHNRVKRYTIIVESYTMVIRGGKNRVIILDASRLDGTQFGEQKHDGGRYRDKK